MTPAEESARLAALAEYEIAYGLSEAEFNAIVQEAAAACETPISLVTFVTEDQQWFKAALGTALTGTARAMSFCTHAIEQQETMVIGDTHADLRFTDHPLVANAPFIRFYAGVPLRTPHGYPLGTLCVLDQQPHNMTETQQQALEALASRVMDLLAIRKAALARKSA